MSDTLTDFKQLQRDASFAYSSDSRLQTVNIITREQLLADKSRLPDETLSIEVLGYITPRNGKQGVCVIVEKPRFEVLNPQAPGPQGDIIIESLILEDQLTNMDPTEGTGLAADYIAQVCLEIGHGWNLNFQSDFVADRNAMVEAKEWQPLRAYKVQHRMVLSRAQTTRVTTPTLTQDSPNPGMITLTNDPNTPDAQIYYTTDGDTPAPDQANATLYEGAFVAPAGSYLLRWAAFKPGYLLSAIAQVNINNQ
jgi:hypothetical protein